VGSNGTARYRKVRPHAAVVGDGRPDRWRDRDLAVHRLRLFAAYRRSPAPQRQIAVIAAVLSGLSITAMPLRAMSMIGAPDGDGSFQAGLDHVPSLFWLVGPPVAAFMGAIAWFVARVDPPTAAPRLTPRQKAPFTTATWRPVGLTTGVVICMAGVANCVVSVVSGSTPLLGLSVLLFGAVILGQARTRLVIPRVPGMPHSRQEMT
jgi:hypothetical protein